MSDDDDLMARLRHIAADVEGVPDLVDESARAAFLTRRLDDEIATLLGDSATHPATVRAGTPAPRLLSYESGPVSLDLEVDDDPDGGHRLRGLVTGAEGDVEVDAGPGTTLPAVVDDLGWFTVTVPRGPVRVRVRAADGTPVTTGWLRW